MVHHIITGRAAIAASRHQTVGVSIAAAALPSSSIANSSLLKTNQTFNYHNHRQLQLPTQHMRYFAADAATSANTIDQPEIKLYQYHICPFCNITKSLLKYSNLDYERIEVNPLTKAELKPWSGEYKKVPIAIIGDKQVNGSENILDALLDLPTVQAVIDKQSNDFSKSENAQKWTRFAIDDLAALLYPNICGTLRDSYDTFGYVKNVDTFSPLQQTSIQYIGALAMYFAASKVKCKSTTTDKCAYNAYHSTCLISCYRYRFQQNEISLMKKQPSMMH